MGWLRRGKRPGTQRVASSADADHLADFADTRTGVEAYLEPRTAVTAHTVVLVAADGEWTRRRIADPAAAASFARKRGLPLYEVEKVGYPQRMRDWTERKKAAGSAEAGSS